MSRIKSEEIARRFARRNGCTLGVARTVVQQIVSIIDDALISGEHVCLTGLLTLSVTDRERCVRNPVTGEKAVVVRANLRAVPLKGFRTRLNQAHGAIEWKNTPSSQTNNPPEK